MEANEFLIKLKKKYLKNDIYVSQTGQSNNFPLLLSCIVLPRAYKNIQLIFIQNSRTYQMFYWH